jgi:D-inositol-3-phosphate glycosyltransferase
MSMEEHPVRLVLVDLSPHIGLAERSLWELASRLRPERYSVKIWLSGDPQVSGLAEALAARGLWVERFGEARSRWDWRTAFGVWLRLRRERPMLVHVHHSGSAGSLRVARAASADGIPVLLTRHSAAPLAEAQAGADERRVYGRADRVSVAVRADAEELVRGWGLDRKRVRWIPYGAEVPDEERESAAALAWRSELGARPFRPLWVCPLRLERNRGHDVLIDAVAELRRRELQFLVVLAGAGPLCDPLRRRVDELGLASVVRFLDDVDDPGPLMTAADAVVFPVVEGPVPLTLLDALARGRPVVASSLPAVEEVVENGVSGKLVVPRDAGALADALESFHFRPDAALRLGRSAARRARDEFSWSRIVDAFEDVYDEILGLASFVPGGEPVSSRD